MKRMAARRGAVHRFRVGGIGVLVAGSLAAAVSLAAGPKAPGASDPARIPVIVELFTSEGCSSCPPADEVLTRLVAAQPVAGAEIIALGEHVDTWDHLGWRDPFSARALSTRQSDYDEKVFHRGGVYTPQMVVDGREEFTGSDYSTATTAVKTAVRRAEARVQVTVGAERSPSGASMALSARVEVPPEARLSGSADVLLALVEDGLETQVLHGENGGRRLSHSAVVRLLKPVGAVSAREGHWAAVPTLELSSKWKADRLRAVVFVQERATRRILGAASTGLPTAGGH